MGMGKGGMKRRENAMSRGEHEKEVQKLATMLHVLPLTLKPVDNLICCKRGLTWVVKRATSPFNSRHCKPYPVQQYPPV